MWSNLIILLLLSLNNNVLSLFKGHLYGIDQSSITAVSFVEIIDNSTNYNRLLDLGRLSISGRATAMKTLNNENYIVTYHVFDSRGVPYYYILTIDINNTSIVKKNSTLNGPGSGSFWQIADDQKQIVGIRESSHAGASLEVATIEQSTGKVKTVGLYPYGSYSLIMAFARQRRIYYNIIDSSTFCGINVDTGILDINVQTPNDYLIYAIIYDSIKDRLISIVYSATVVEKAWFIATIIIDKSSSTIKFERIGKSIIPMEGKYLWSTTYTLALKERQWITLWDDFDAGDNSILITIDIDDAQIMEKQIINDSKYLNNLVYFD